VNYTAVKALILATVAGIAITFVPALQPMANFAWFTGCFLGGGLFYLFARRRQAHECAALTSAVAG
jgi:NCS1 family nucleobase:cation symporter-1